MLTSKQRAFLRGQANALPVVFQIGKGEIDEQVIESTRSCLAARELIKMKVLENSQYNAAEAAEILCEEVGCESVQIIGSKFVLYRETHSKPKEKRIELVKAKKAKK